MAEVAIAAVDAVFDWKTYLTENFGYDADGIRTGEGQEKGQ
jgi:putative lipase involved disintegration of autophagic bodies